MKIQKFGVYLADLNPRTGTEPGKTRPVVVVQTNLLNPVHSSTIICPITTQTIKAIHILRIHLQKDECGIRHDSDILVDQIRVIDNRRFIKKLGQLNISHQEKLLQNLQALILE